MSETARDIVNAVSSRPDRDALTQALRRAHFRVAEATDPDHVLRLARARPCLILLDGDPGDVARLLAGDPETTAVPVLHVVAPVEPAGVVAQVESLLRPDDPAVSWFETSARRFQAVFEGITEGVCLLDRRGLVRLCNPALADLAGDPCERFLGRPFADLARRLFGADDPRDWDEQFAPAETRRRVLTRDNRRYRVRTSPLLGEAGERIGTAVVVEDVSPPKASEEKGAPFRTLRDEYLEREARVLENVIQNSPLMSVTAQLYGRGALREAFPEVFRDIARRYGALMEKALDQRGYQVNYPLSEELRALGEQLGFLGAGPRDVVEVHQAALKQKQGATAPAKTQVYVEEGRFLILELMGHLAAHYRKYSMGSLRAKGDPSVTPRHPPEE